MMSPLYEQALSDFKFEALFTPGDDVLLEHYALYVKPRFDTACWTWSPPHRIAIGDQVLKRIKRGSDDAAKREYLKKYLWHEYAHACFTERDFVKTNRHLERIRAPFAVYNRFEDIRIEHRARTRWIDFRFEWSKFEELTPVSASSPNAPDAILFHLTQLEGNVDAARRLVDDQKLFNEVLPFYWDGCAAKDSIALMSVIARWVRKFPQCTQEGGLAEGGMQDLPLSAQLALSPGAAEAFFEDTQEAGKPAKPSPQPLVALELYDPKQDASREAGTGHLLGDRPVQVDAGDVADVTQLLKQVYAKREVKVSTFTPTRRISVRHLVLGRAPYRKAVLAGKKTKRVAVVVDCSGSMSGHIAGARVLISALSELAEAGSVKGNVILSKVGSDGPVWERFSLPMDIGAIQRIVADGHGEGLQPALQANRQMALESDLLLVYTDGNITDAPLNKKMLHSLGVFTWGVYVGTANNATVSLKRYFDNVLVKPTVRSLVEALLLTL